MNIGQSDLDVDNYFDSDEEIEFTIHNGNGITWLTKYEVKELIKYLNVVLEVYK
jgi:hypothetical protein